MDIPKVKVQKFSLLKSKVFITIAVAIALLIFFKGFSKDYTVEQKDLVIEKVMKGNLDVTVQGYGKIVSEKPQLLTTYSAATVKEVLLKPGALVDADSTIVILENVELEQDVEIASQDLIKAEANLRQLRLNNDREILRESSTLAGIETQLETLKLKNTAERDLVKQGVVSKLSYRESELEIKQLEHQVALHKQQIEQLKLVHKESINIEAEQVRQKHSVLQLRQERLQQLHVKAGVSGILQRLSVELGERLTPGQEVALVGSLSELIALINIPQGDAQLVDIGARATIDTRKHLIEGKVTRVSPVVEANTVEVEIELPEQLPSSARLQLNIDGNIYAESLSNIKYVRKPSSIKANSSDSLYKVNGETAELIELQFGRAIGQYIQILSGIDAGEQLIISDQRRLYQSHSSLVIR